nr:hypothetical protein [uncultured Cohaesibacter sp.]
MEPAVALAAILAEVADFTPAEASDWLTSIARAKASAPPEALSESSTRRYQLFVNANTKNITKGRRTVPTTTIGLQFQFKKRLAAM